MSNPIVLGVDPGTYAMGYAVISEHAGQLIHIQSGVFKPHKTYALERRLAWLHEELSALIMHTQPSVLAVETVFARKNVASAVALAHARAIAILAGSQNNLLVAQYSPMEVKQAAVGYGRATKAQVAHMMHRLFHFSKEKMSPSYDQSDALAVALCHLNTQKTHRAIIPPMVVVSAQTKRIS